MGVIEGVMVGVRFRSSKGPSSVGSGEWVLDFHMSKVCPTLQFRWPVSAMNP